METSVLNPNSIMPLYAQIVDKLEEDIKLGRFSQTGRLPTEGELSEQYSVSRITIRRAMDELSAKGLVEKKQGKGTFICGRKFTRDLAAPQSFTEICAQNGMKSSAKLLEAAICVPKSAQIKTTLGLGENDAAVHIKRLRYADDKPLMMEDNYYPLEYAYLLSIDLENDSTYRYLREEKGIVLRRTNTRICIVRADSKLAKLLQVNRNAPELEMTGLVVNLEGAPVHTSYQIGYGENFEIVVR